MNDTNLQPTKNQINPQALSLCYITCKKMLHGVTKKWLRQIFENPELLKEPLQNYSMPYFMTLNKNKLRYTLTEPRQYYLPHHVIREINEWLNKR